MTQFQTPPNNVAITVLGRTYTVKCTKDEKPVLERAVERVESTMIKMTQGHKHPSPEQIAIVTALNLAAQLEAQSTEQPVLKPSEQQLRDQEKIDAMTMQCQEALDLKA